jgi:CHAT domain-containing protein/tetratricopeptide (TPR) repeat protein
MSLASADEANPRPSDARWSLTSLTRWADTPRGERTLTPLPPDLAETLALSEEIVAFSRGYPSRALQLSKVLVEVARAGKPAVQAAARRCRGHMFRRLGRNREALRDYRRAQAGFREQGMTLEAARTVIGMVDALGRLGRNQDALAAGHWARRVFLRHEEHGRAARLDTNLALILERAGKPREALDVHRRAASIFERLGATSDLAMARFNTANALVSLDRYEEALKLYRSSAETWKSLDATSTLCRCQLALGSVLLRLGRLDEALRQLEETSELALGLDDPVVTATATLDRSRAELLVGRLDGVAARLEGAIDGFRSLGIRDDQAESLSLRASLWTKLGRLDDALGDWVRAAELYRSIRHASGAARADFARAEILARLGRAGESRALLRSALRGLERHGPASAEIEARLVLADQVLESRPPQAQRHLEFVERRSRAIHDPWTEYRTQILRARLALRTDSSRRARLALNRAYRIAQGLRSLAPLESLQAEWLGRRDELFDLALHPGVARGEVPWMLLWSERVRVPLRMFRVAPSSIEPGADPDWMGFEQAREEIHWLDAGERSRRWSSASAGPASRRLTEWRRKRARAMVRLERFGRRLELRAIRQHGSGPDAEPSAVSIQKTLSKDEAFIEFFVGRHGLVTFVVTRESMRAIETTKDPGEIHEIVVRLRQVWERYRLGSAFVRRHQNTLAATTAHLLRLLRQDLLDPVLRILPENLRQLVVSPHAWLRVVPFHAMVEDRCVRYVPSGASLVAEKGASTSIRDDVLIIGVSSEDAPEAEREARAVARSYPDGTLLLGKDATPRAVRSCWPRATLIHVAAHGSLQTDDPRLSGIQLSGGTWTVHDLRTVPTRAELVVLSSCHSGGSIIWGQDYEVGLLPTLFEQGPRTAVVSLWPADDQATGIFMSAFHHDLALGKSVLEALGTSRRVVREVKPDPYYWAPFVPYGADRRGGMTQ